MFTMKIGYIGLGLLGLPMAQNLVDAGHVLRVYNRTAAKADPLIAKGATRVDQPADVVVPGGIVVTSLWDGPVVQRLVTPELLERLRGGLHISTSTILPETSRLLAVLHAAHGVGYVEAPIFGRPEAAVAKQLWVPYAGAAADKARAKPVLEAMGAQGLFDLGDMFGTALATKLAGNMMIVSAVRSFAEALQMAQHAGADPKLVAAMLTSSLFSAPIYQGYGQRLVEEHAKSGTIGTGFSGSKIPEKDLGLFVETAAPSASSVATLLRTLVAG
jgi:3-hydroxyisobutyrate dehydrogenase-like beta-hydroxyacid dehydrogenase